MCVCVCVCVCECDCISVYVQGESEGVEWEVRVERLRVYVCITEELTLPLIFFRPKHECHRKRILVAISPPTLTNSALITFQV